MQSKEFGVTVQTRKKWQRPKSDYGTRFFSKKNAWRALDTVVEKDGTENDSGQKDEYREEHGIEAESENILDQRQSDSGGLAEKLCATIGVGSLESGGTKKSDFEGGDNQGDGQGLAHNDQHNTTGGSPPHGSHNNNGFQDIKNTTSGRRGHMGSSNHFQR